MGETMGGTITRRGVLAASAAGLALATARHAAADAGLKFWSWRQEDRPFYQKTIAAFAHQHPGTSIAFETFEPTSYQTVLSTALAAGRGPDVIQVRAYGNLETVAAPGYLLALDQQTVPELTNFGPSALAAETLHAAGKVYALPFAQQSMLVIYNQALFDKAGVKPPESWDDLIAVCKALQAKGITPFANGTATAWINETLVGSLLPSVIGKAFEADVLAGKADFTDPRFVGALARLEGLKPYLAPSFTGIDYATSQQLFVAGRAAMFAGGSYELANFRHQNPALKLDVFASPPARAGDERLGSLYYDGGYAVNAKSPNRGAALAFLRSLGTPEYGTAFTNALLNVSPIRGIRIEDPLLQKVAEMD
jgi:raffinose/stachyose/melibiose transport system substrate-binding protein